MKRAKDRSKLEAGEGASSSPVILSFPLFDLCLMNGKDRNCSVSRAKLDRPEGNLVSGVSQGGMRYPGNEVERQV